MQAHRSLPVGLGDRHPNNLMLQRVTGKVVHIDFGDCFEVRTGRDSVFAAIRVITKI